MTLLSLYRTAIRFGRAKIDSRLIERIHVRHSSSSIIKSQNVLDTLEKRGLLHQVTAPNSLRIHLNDSKNSPRSIYVGVDPSADSLHVGNLLPLFAALHFVRHGHKAVILIGGATGSIGDPSGRDTERKALSIETLNHNIKCITEQAHQFFEKASEYGKTYNVEGLKSSNLNDQLTIVNNATWYKGVGILDFLREIGKHARITTMLSRDSVKSRLQVDQFGRREGGLSFTEFSYQLLQAYDFSVLHKHPYSCTVQLGGSDQMGNIMAGVDLIRRQKALTNAATEEEEAGANDMEEVNEMQKDEQQPAYGLTLPLLTTSSGAKFGKSAGNAVWLDEKKCSSYDFYQYFFRAKDDEIERYLHSLTFIPLEEIQMILKEHNQDRSKRFAQRALANHLTELCRGKEALEQAEIATKVLFDTELSGLKIKKVLSAFFDDSRLKRLKKEEVIGMDLSKLITQIGLSKTRSDAKRAIANGGLYINNVSIREQNKTLSESDIIGDGDGDSKGLVILRIGKTQHSILVLD